MIKLIMSDMDGTLLSDGNVISKSTIEAIKQAQHQGVLFGVATGREFGSVKEIMNLYDLDIDYAILSNGGQLSDGKGNILKNAYLDKNCVKPVLEILGKDHLPLMIFTTKGPFAPDPVFSRDSFIERLHKTYHVPYEDYQPGGKRSQVPCMRLQPTGPIDDFLKQDLEITKIEAYHLEPKYIEKAKACLKDISNISYLSSFKDNVEITSGQATKGSILKEVIQTLHILEDEVAVIGDGLNDLSLFENFKYSYAVNNAHQQLKEKAYQIVASNNEDGVKEAIEAILMMNEG